MLDKKLQRTSDLLSGFKTAKDHKAISGILKNQISQALKLIEDLKRLSELKGQYDEYITDTIGDIETKIRYTECYWNRIEKHNEFSRLHHFLVSRLIDDLDCMRDAVKDRTLVSFDVSFATLHPLLDEPIHLFLVPGFERWSPLLSPISGHEIGHVVGYYKKDRLFSLFNACIKDFEREIRTVLARLSGEYRQAELNFILEFIRAWNSWRDEIASDLVALHMLGPAFAFATQQSFIGRDPFQLSRTHPPDDLRVRVVIEEMKKPHFNLSESAYFLETEWGFYLEKNSFRKPAVYDSYLKKELIDACVASVTQGCRELGITPYDRSRFAKVQEAKSLKEMDTIQDWLNFLWVRFLDDSDDYYNVEQEFISNIIVEE
jgi:hypothetical protein